MTDIEQKARELAHGIVSDWLQDDSGTEIEQRDKLVGNLASAIRSVAAETYEECVDIAEKIVAENWSPPGAAKYLAAALRARFPKLSP